MAAAVAMRGDAAPDIALRRGLRTTGNLAFVLFATPLSTAGGMPPALPMVLWRAFLGAHAVHASLIVRLMRERGGSITRVSVVGGGVGYATVAALTRAAIAPGPPPPGPRRRRLQRAGHNVLLGLHAFTIAHGYVAKGRNAVMYAPLAALWLAAARGMGRTWM